MRTRHASGLSVPMNRRKIFGVPCNDTKVSRRENVQPEHATVLATSQERSEIVPNTKKHLEHRNTKRDGHNRINEIKHCRDTDTFTLVGSAASADQLTPFTHAALSASDTIMVSTYYTPNLLHV